MNNNLKKIKFSMKDVVSPIRVIDLVMMEKGAQCVYYLSNPEHIFQFRRNVHSYSNKFNGRVTLETFITCNPESSSSGRMVIVTVLEQGHDNE